MKVRNLNIRTEQGLAEGIEFKKKEESQEINERSSSKMKKTDLRSLMREEC